MLLSLAPVFVGDAALAGRFTLRIDPNWPHQKLWRHPMGSLLAFTYVDWSGGLQETANVNYAPTEVPGRAESYQSYTGTDSREIQITFNFQVQGQSGGSLSDALMREVVWPARFLDALKYPVFSTDQERSYRPPPCILRVGELLTARVIVTTADITWGGSEGTILDPDTLLPQSATVSTTFRVVRRAKSDLGYPFDDLGNWQ